MTTRTTVYIIHIYHWAALILIKIIILDLSHIRLTLGIKRSSGDDMHRGCHRRIMGLACEVCKL